MSQLINNEDVHWIESTSNIINELFNDLTDIFPAWNQSGSSLDDMKRIWLKAFIEHKIVTSEQIERGLKRCLLITSPFMPTVGQFIEWTKPMPEDLNLPSTEVAYAIACFNAKPYNTDKQPWKHVAVRYASHLTGTYGLNTQPKKISFPIFKKNYESLISKLIAGEKEADIFPKGMLRQQAEFEQIAHDGKKQEESSNINCATKSLSEIYALLGRADKVNELEKNPCIRKDKL